MKSAARLVLCLLVFGGVYAQQRPLVTETTDTVPEGQVLFGLGLEMYQNAEYRLSGLTGDLTRFGVYSFRIGIGRAAEFELEGSARDVLNIDRQVPAPGTPSLKFSGTSTDDFGDIFLATKMRLRDEKGAVPAIGFRFAVELPNAQNESGLGNDETNAFASILLTKKLGRATVAGNVGLAILGDPIDAGSQDDLTTYGLAVLYPAGKRVTLLADWYGRVGPGGVGTEEQSRLRAGLRVDAAGFVWDASVFAGLRSTDPDSGLLLGISKQFKLPF